jgi:hypothetical protein
MRLGSGNQVVSRKHECFITTDSSEFGLSMPQTTLVAYPL